MRRFVALNIHPSCPFWDGFDVAYSSISAAWILVDALRRSPAHTPGGEESMLVGEAVCCGRIAVAMQD